MLVLAPPVPAAAAGQRMVQNGFFPSDFHDARRTLEIDASARRIFEIGQPLEGHGMHVKAYDLDTLAPAGRVRIPGAQSGIGGSLTAVDDLRHRMYVMFPMPLGEEGAVRDIVGPGVTRGTIDELARTLFGVAAIDTLSLDVIGTGVVALAQPAPPKDFANGNTVGFKAMSYARDGERDLLYLASEVPVGLSTFLLGLHTVHLHEIDLGRLFDPTGPSAVNWSFHVKECAATMARGVPGVIYRSPVSPDVFMPCRQGGFEGTPFTQPLETPGVVRVTLPEQASSHADTAGFRTAFYPVSGSMQYGATTVDPVAGRIFLKVEGSTTEAGVWVFDTPSASWIGLVVLPAEFTADKLVGIGTDVSSGRLYAVSSFTAGGTSSVSISSTRGKAADQGTVTAFVPDPVPTSGRIVVDPIRHRLFTPAEGGYIGVADTEPPRPAIAEHDPDAGTSDIAEGPGTDVNYVAGAQAYGARMRWVGGIRGVDRNTNTVWENPPDELSPNTGGIFPPPPAPGTRDLHMARVLHTTLTNGEATGKATGMQRDLENTDADLAGGASWLRRWGGPDLTGERWPWEIVDCTDFGGARDHREAEGYGAITRCDRGTPEVSAAAINETLENGTPLRVGDARARTYSYRDAKRGIVSISEAEALGVEVEGRFGIGRIAARAETWATGRPKASNGIGAGSTYVREFQDVWVVGENGERDPVCAASCDPGLVRDAVNRSLGARARVDLPEPEPARAAGTPGGFEALVIRDRNERANEAAINEEADQRRLEVPALVVTVFSDGRVPSRMILSFAAVAAESHYGIFALSQGVPFAGPPLIGPTGDVPAPLAPPPSPPSFDDVPREPRGGGVSQIVRTVFDGLTFIVSAPVRSVRAAGMWLFLAAPLLLWMRRRGLPGLEDDG